MNTLDKYSLNLESNDTVHLVSLNDHSIQIIVPSNCELELKVPSIVSRDTGIGLIPLFGTIENLTTQGLLWDVEEELRIEFGGFLSTSNGFNPENDDNVLTFKNQGNQFLLSLDLSND